MVDRQAHIEVTRAIRLSAPELADALVGLRREMTGLRPRWSLAMHGSLELDLRVRPAGSPRPSRLALAGSLRSSDLTELAAIRITATSETHTSAISLLPTDDASLWHDDHLRAYLDAAHAALDELCEELLWHAAHQARAAQHSV